MLQQDPLVRSIEFAQTLTQALDAGRPPDEVWRLAMDEFRDTRSAAAAVAAALCATGANDGEGALMAIALALAFGKAHSALLRQLAQALARRRCHDLARSVILLAWERYVEEIKALGAEPPPGLQEDYLRIAEAQGAC